LPDFFSRWIPGTFFYSVGPADLSTAHPRCIVGADPRSITVLIRIKNLWHRLFVERVDDRIPESWGGDWTS
jgi:hypothetical protein